MNKKNKLKYQFAGIMPHSNTMPAPSWQTTAGQFLQGAGGIANMIPGVGPLVGMGLGLAGNIFSKVGQSEAIKESQTPLMNQNPYGFQFGGQATSPQGMQGGQPVPLSNNAMQVKAHQPSQTDSIDAGEVMLDHNEVVVGDKVFSSTLKNPWSNVSFAEQEKATQKALCKFEKYQTKTGDTEMKDKKYHEKNSEALFNTQENVATLLGLRNPDGTPVQSVEAKGPKEGFIWGGLKTKMESGGKMGYINGGPINPLTVKQGYSVTDPNAIKELAYNEKLFGFNGELTNEAMYDFPNKGVVDFKPLPIDFKVNAQIAAIDPLNGLTNGRLLRDKINSTQPMDANITSVEDGFGIPAQTTPSMPYNLGANNSPPNVLQTRLNNLEGIDATISDVYENNISANADDTQLVGTTYEMGDNVGGPTFPLMLTGNPVTDPIQNMIMNRQDPMAGKYPLQPSLSPEEQKKREFVDKVLGNPEGTSTTVQEDKNMSKDIQNLMKEFKGYNPYGEMGTMIGQATSAIGLMMNTPRYVKYADVGQEQIRQQNLALLRLKQGEATAKQDAILQGKTALSNLNARSLQSRNANLRNIATGTSKALETIGGQFAGREAQMRTQIGNERTNIELQNQRKDMYQDDINTKEYDTMLTQNLQLMMNQRNAMIEKQLAFNKYRQDKTLESLLRTRNFEWNDGQIKLIQQQLADQKEINKTLNQPAGTTTTTTGGTSTGPYSRYVPGLGTMGAYGYKTPATSTTTTTYTPTYNPYGTYVPYNQRITIR